MNRGFLESLPVQQMMMSAGNPNWWNINNTVKPPPLLHSQLQPNPSTTSLLPQYPPSSLPLNFLENDHNHQELPESWCQLLMGGSPIVEEGDERLGLSNQYNQQVKKLENWEEQIFYPSEANDNNSSIVDHVKQEVSESAAYAYGLVSNGEFQTSNGRVVPNWSPHHQVMPVSSPSSCVTSFSSNSMLDFSTTKSDNTHGTKHHPQPDHSSECNSTATGGAFKKARVQQSSTQSTFKVRKEKIGDRITALHQLVSPFGKTDTASVLLEAIGYIRFLQNQIEALSLPYLGSGSGNMNQQLQHQQQSVQGEKNCIFPEDPGQLLHVDTNNMKRRGVPDQDSENAPRMDLRSRGLCLVPLACTLQVGSDNAADFWAPTLGGGFR
ncbi:hypothetical protein C5167_051184 [Papaver somniferum]|uniref:BHLH domain-containing protein n=1 Tax=Papaver somniferum TaxID=3469 RepID=A0A4Y7KTL1_PAPSO|nr:transcription factor bHLH68-like [Papaver somniferum]RZC75700.1 hypothetical protein C5167_051184 [Papaver somniferum]